MKATKMRFLFVLSFPRGRRLVSKTGRSYFLYQSTHRMHFSLKGRVPFLALQLLSVWHPVTSNICLSIWDETSTGQKAAAVLKGGLRELRMWLLNLGFPSPNRNWRDTPPGHQVISGLEMVWRFVKSIIYLPRRESTVDASETVQPNSLRGWLSCLILSLHFQSNDSDTPENRPY